MNKRVKLVLLAIAIFVFYIFLMWEMTEARARISISQEVRITIINHGTPQQACERFVERHPDVGVGEFDENGDLIIESFRPYNCDDPVEREMVLDHLRGEGKWK